MKTVPTIVKHPVYRMNRETLATAHRKVDGIEMNIKVPYRLAIFAIIIKILIFEIVLMRARREKCSNRSKYSPAQYVNHWLPAARWRGKRGSAPLLGMLHFSSVSKWIPFRVMDSFVSSQELIKVA